MLQHIGEFQMSRKSRYNPPSDVHRTSLKSILSLSNRGQLAANQMSFLDKAAEKAGASDLPIWCAGRMSLVERRAIAVIGTRNVSELGRKRASKFARELAASSIVVVSGLAAGVDAQALGSAMEAGGDVIAVIGTPIDKAYPIANAELQQDIYKHHLLISQFPSGERTFPSHFPARNRTMAAISDGSVIIEASESSGTLHQASECVKLGRWLGIAKSVVDNPDLSWPARFLSYPRCVVLESTEEFIQKVYG